MDENTERTIQSARSFLFVPGNQPSWFSKAADSTADVKIVDLEDAVGRASKENARAWVQDWFAVPRDDWLVRINGLMTDQWLDDINALSPVIDNLAGLVVPGADSRGSLDCLHAALGGRPGLIPLIESAAGLEAAQSIGECPAVLRLAFGNLDYAADIGANGSPESLLTARASLVAVSRLCRLPRPIDGVSTFLDDSAATRSQAEYGAALGFGGMLCIHPRQVYTVNLAYAPSDADVTWARKILAADATGDARRVGEEMVDEAVFRRARAILTRAHR